MSAIELAIKVDVDTERGTRVGVPALLRLFDELDVRATFLFSLGPDNTGRAVRRIFRRGFFGKVARTDVIGVYGWRTLLNGLLWPGPHIGRRHAAVLRAVRERGHEVGIHCYDHIRWQDGLATMTRAEVFAEFDKARVEFERIFGEPARAAGAAGWQANALSLEAYDAAGLMYASDTRGTHVFLPVVAGRLFKTVQIPTTLPTLDELLGRPEYPAERLPERYLSWLRPGRLNVLTIHAEIEGMSRAPLFRAFLTRAHDTRFTPLQEIARRCLVAHDALPACHLVPGEVDGRSGTLAVQGGLAR